MSVSQKTPVPQVSDWKAEEILAYVQEERGLNSEQDWQEEFGMTVDDIMQMAQNLEPGEEDMERQIYLMDMISDFQDDYESRHQVREEDAKHREEYEGRVRYITSLRDPDNSEAWMTVDETEWVE